MSVTVGKVWTAKSGTHPGTTLQEAGFEDVSFLPIARTVLAPPGQFSRGGDKTTEVKRQVRALYLDRADAAWTKAEITLAITDAASDVLCEVGICKGGPVAGNGASLTLLGYLDVTASWGSTGNKLHSVTIAGVTVGDHLWVIWGQDDAGAQPTYATLDACVADYIRSGTFLYCDDMMPDEMAGATAFSLESNSVLPIRTVVFMSS